MHISRIILLALKHEASVEELRELEKWRQASPDNERDYRQIVHTWELTAGGDNRIIVGPPPAVTDIVAAGSRHAAPVELVRSPPAIGRFRASLRRGRWFPYAAAAAVALSIAVLRLGSLRIGGSAGEDRLVTGKSETATVSLKDGTVIRVAPSSTLSIPEGAGAERRVTLEGRAFFAVAHDRAHPFRIRTAAGYVTVLGTRFDLRAQDTSLSIIVLEGAVSLSAAGHRIEVHRGEMGRVSEGMILPIVRVPNPVAAMAWRGRFLAFQDTPLDEVAREIAREYGVRVQIADPALARRTVTGWFVDQSLEDVVRITCAVAAVHCITEGGVVTMTKLPDGSPAAAWRSDQ